MLLTKQYQSIIVANTVMHFDNALYSYMVPIIAPIFFPDKEEAVQLMLGYSILTISCIAKPLGGLLFCMLTIYTKENRLLCYILLSAGICQIAIGCLPTYSSLPLWGTLGLLFFRFCIEICAAGEYHIARLYVIQWRVDSQQIKLWAVYYEIATMGGIILASIVTTLLVSMKDPLFYWRLPFIIAGMTTLLCLIFFRGGEANFIPTNGQALSYPNLTSLFKQLWEERKAIIAIAVVMGFSYLTYAVPFLFIPKFIPMITNLTYANMMQHTTPFMVLDILLLGWMGRIGQKLDHRMLMLLASSTIALSIMPIFRALQTASIGYVIFIRFWIVFWGVVFNCFVTVWCKEQIHRGNPYLAIGFATVIGISLFGKPTTSICWMLYHKYGSPLTPAFYIASLAGITALTLVHKGKK